MSTKLMQRIFCAYKNQEDLVLNQIQNDIEIAKEDGRLETEQYSIIADDEGIDIYDKVNDEITHIDEKDDVYQMSVPTHVPELPLGTSVMWMDDSGIMQEGTLEAINGDIATVSINGAPNSIKYDLLKPVDESSKEFADIFKDKFIFRLGDYDLEYDIKKRMVRVLDDNVKAEWQVNPSKSFDDFLKSTAEKLKTLKDDKEKKFSNNLKNFSETTRKYFSTKSEGKTEDSKLRKFSEKTQKFFSETYYVVECSDMSGTLYEIRPKNEVEELLKSGGSRKGNGGYKETIVGNASTKEKAREIVKEKKSMKKE